MRNKKNYRLECYKSRFEDIYEEYNFETLEKAQDFIRVNKLIGKYERIKIMHLEYEYNTTRAINYEDLSRMGVEMYGQ